MNGYNFITSRGLHVFIFLINTYILRFWKFYHDKTLWEEDKVCIRGLRIYEILPFKTDRIVNCWNKGHPEKIYLNLEGGFKKLILLLLDGYK